MILQKNNIRLKPCNQWIAVIKEGAVKGGPFYFSVFNYKGDVLFESSGFKDAASCEQGIWDLRNEIIEKDDAEKLDGCKFTNRIYRDTDVIGRIFRARLLRSSRVRIKTKKKKKGLVDDNATIDVSQSKLCLHRKKEIKMNKKVLGVLHDSARKKVTYDEFFSVFRQSGQVVYALRKKKDESITSPVTSRVIDFMYSLDGRGKIINNDVEYQDTANPTTYKQWEDCCNVFWNNDRVREFFEDVIVGEKNEK